jgi:dihydroorotase
MMLSYVKKGIISIEKVVEKMAHAPAICFQIAERGFIREGYYADLVLVDLDTPSMVTKASLLYKCQWSPLEGTEFSSSIHTTIVNGAIVYENAKVIDGLYGMRLKFDRA